MKKNGLIKPTESVSYFKTDWNSKLSEKPNASNSVSYCLFAENGTKINMDLCNSTVTDIHFPIKDREQINLTLIEEYNKKGFNILDPNSNYFNDRCIPMKENDTAVTLADRRKDFKNITIQCSTGCQPGKINTTTGYFSCKCSPSNTSEVFSNLDKIFLKTLNSSNFMIATCFKTVFTFVSFYFNCSLTSLRILVFMRTQY